ncbi:MAG: putative inorganic carbon transporter subunit DabA, partial [Aestuariivirga sp.]
RYLKSGRILVSHIEEALAPLARDEEVALGPCRISHREVLRACLTHGLSMPVDEPLDRLMEREPSEEQAEALAERLVSLSSPTVQERMTATVREDLAALGRDITLTNWCDRTLGTQIVDQINGELIKWCEAFLDEGHATWSMPGREQGLYAAWKRLAVSEWTTCGITESRHKIASLPEHPEDTVFECLEALAIPAEFRQDYLSLQLAALPGWAGFIKWRAEENGYAWQQAYPVGLVKFLVVRLWYVRELVQKVCQEALGIEGHYRAISAYMQQYPQAYFMRKERAAGRLPALYADRVERLHAQTKKSPDAAAIFAREWELLAQQYQMEFELRHQQAARRVMARRLLTLAQALEIVPSLLMDGPPAALRQLVDWMDAFPESAHGPVWLKAFEAEYQQHLFGMLQRGSAKPQPAGPGHLPPVRPHSQSVFCIDVRSEPFRRHLESTGAHDTYGFAGFFAVFIRYRAWGKEHETEQFPVIMRAKNEVREIPRSYLDHFVSKHQSRAK